MLRNTFILLLSVYLFACTASRIIGKSAREKILDNSALKTAHVGISIYDPESNKYLYNYQGDKYFVPASNTKIPTCYAAMKYLGDSLPGLRYRIDGNYLFLEPTGDPSFLLSEFKLQPVFNFLNQTDKTIFLNLSNWKDRRWGSGWSWNDYSEDYMAERSAMPVYGNLVRFSGPLNALRVVPNLFADSLSFDSTNSENSYPGSVRRDIAANNFIIGISKKESSVEVPFHTKEGEIIFRLLSDTLHKQIMKRWLPYDSIEKSGSIIHSQPTDSLLKPMMHRSDNFFAEQTLLMVSNELLGTMNDTRIIDTLMKTDFKDLPQKPRWVDGSGLSRYNLFTPQDFVAILNKIKKEFGMKRVQEIFATGNEGTLTNYYLADSSFIYAKTGTLSGVVAISGFLYTKKQKLLIFSVLVNNHQASATQVRRAVESFIQGIRENY